MWNFSNWPPDFPPKTVGLDKNKLVSHHEMFERYDYTLPKYFTGIHRQLYFE